jgi:hypothetical protein
MTVKKKPKRASGAFDKARFGRGTCGHAIQLKLRLLDDEALGDDELEDVELSEAVWVQVATEGEYLGYADGEDPFELTRDIFQELIDNLHNHPSFKANALSGEGAVGIIPWDFNHASELHPGSGDLPITGAPAQAWTRDLEIREGPDGKAQLWALTEFKEPARTYVKEQKYKWASVSIWFDVVDPISGKDIGAVLTSIALTNTPFIEGMTPLAASRQRARLQAMLPSSKPRKIAAVSGEPASGEHVTASFYAYQAGSPEEAYRCLKQLFGLPMLASYEDVLAQVAKLQEMVTADVAPAGVDVMGTLDNLKTVLGLPVLSTADEVFASVTELFTQLAQAEDQAVDPAAEATKKELERMSLKILASKLGVKENEDAVVAAVAELIELADGMRTLFARPNADCKVLLKAGTDAKGVMDKLGALLKALGVEQYEEGVSKIAGMFKQVAELEQVMPELKRLRDSDEKRETEDAENEVAAAMATRGYKADDPGLKASLLLLRKTNREEFRKMYPPPSPSEAHLSRTITAAPAAGEEPRASGAGPSNGVVRVFGDGKPVHLNGYSGANKIQRCMSFLRSQPGGDKLSLEELFPRGCEMAKCKNVIDEAEAV